MSGLVRRTQRSFAIVGDTAISEIDHLALDAFWQRAIKQHPELDRDHTVRWIGIDQNSSELIIDYIKSGEKTATFTLPWVNQAEGYPDGHLGLPIILLSYFGAPELIVQVTSVEPVTFGDIDDRVTRLDGPPVRDPEIWIPLHTEYWNGILANYNREVTPEMPVLVEHFTPVYYDDGRK